MFVKALTTFMGCGTFENSSLYAVAPHEMSIAEMVLTLLDWRGWLPPLCHPAVVVLL
jgi:hypothetical protein